MFYRFQVTGTCEVPVTLAQNFYEGTILLL